MIGNLLNMLTQYVPNVKATITLLRLLGVKVNNSTVNETLQNHPDWPSLLCISDSLNKWNISNAAGKIDKNDIDRLPPPFLAYVHDNDGAFVVVQDVSENRVGFFARNYNKYIQERKEEFLKKWDGVYLVAEKNTTSGEHSYNRVRQQFYINTLFPLSLFFMLIAFSFSFLQGRLVDNTINTAGTYIHLILLLTGVCITLLLLWYEVDKKNPLIQKVCTGLVKSDCNSILSGKQAKLFNWLNWSEVGFVYFSGSLLALLFVTGPLTGTIAFLSWVGILALPYTIFSIYYQWRVAKQWCLLCVSIQVLLVAAAVNTISSGFLAANYRFSEVQIIHIFILYVLPGLAWCSVKPYILQLQQAKDTKREYLRLKFNSEIFDTLLKKQTPVTVPTDGLGIDIGNREAVNTLIKVCNPYCGPCAKAHLKIDELLNVSKNLKVKIIFTVPDEDINSMAKPVRHLMAIAANNRDTLTKKALDDWYLAQTKDYNVFAGKYPMNDELPLQGSKLNDMDKWCREMKIKVTPTFFVNGYQLPDVYGIEDLKYFLSE